MANYTGHSSPRKESDSYPALMNLVRAYFNQDYDRDGETPDDIIREYKACNDPQRIRRLIDEIRVFMSSYSENDAALSSAFERVFMPEDTFYNYDGRSTSEGLRKIIEILS